MIDTKVDNFLKQKDFTLEGKRILVGVSGGPDSLALLHYLWGKQQTTDFFLVVAHVDHMFRGNESYQEAKFVEAVCQNLGIPFRMAQINVPAYKKESGKSAQVASRECRYQFFNEVMEELRLTNLALAHHGDDQIETMLMRITRGSSGASRAGIPFSRVFHKGIIIRPFLCLSREEIETYCVEKRLEPRRDPSNEKDDYLRNRYRKYVVPYLRRENEKVHEHFQRFSEELQQEEELLQELTSEKMNTVWIEKSLHKISIDIDEFLKLPIPLQRRGIQLILNYLYQKRPETLSSLHISALLSLLNSNHPSGSLNFPSGLNVMRSYQKCHFLFQIEEDSPKYRYELWKPGDCNLPNGDTITLQFLSDIHRTNANNILLNKEDITFPLIIRTKEPGDRMSLKGMEGTKKVKSIFIDQKIPLEDREKWPVITDAHNRILWLPRLKKCHDADPSENATANYILLTFSKE